MMNKKMIYGLLMAFMLFSGCGSGGSDSKDKSSDFVPSNSEENLTNTSSNNEKNLTGIFIDSKVEGVKYVTSSGVEGYTNSNGEYKYNDGDKVDFFVNELKLGSTKAQELTTVFDLEYPEKVALLLQSIDSDGNPNNGIQLSQDTIKMFKNTNFTIDEVNPESKDFIKKYNSLTGRDITLESTIANNHAINSLKKVIINDVSDKFFDAIRLNNYDFTVLDTNKNGKDYIHSLRAKIRTFLVIEPVATTLNSTSKLLHLQSQGIMYDAKEFQKEVENITDTFTKVVSIGGIVTSGYKNLKELTRIRTAFSATTGYVNDAKFWKEFTDLTKNITLSEAQGQALKTGFFSVSDDPETEKKISDCYGALVPDGFGQVQCFGRLAGEIFYNANNVVENIKGLSLELKRASIDISYHYLELYYFLDAENNPQVLADALTEIANNKLSKNDAKKYQFSSFDPLNDKDLEKALDLFSMVLGYAVYEPILDNVFAYNYYYDYAKKTILDKQNFIENTTEFYMSSFDKSLLYDIDSEYLDIDIQIEPSDNQDYYKACVNVDNISSVYLKEIIGNLNLYLDSKLIKIDNLFVGDLAHTTNTFAQRCSENFPLIFKEKVLSLGIVKAEYSFKYLPNTHDNIEKEREQVGSKYFEINKHSFAEDVAMPIIKLDIPKFIKPNEQIKLDASKTISLLKDDTFTYSWEYLTSNSPEEDIGLTDTESAITYIKSPKLPDSLSFKRHSFQLVVTSKTNGRQSVKKFSIFVKNEKKEDEVPEVVTPTPTKNPTPTPSIPTNSSQTSNDYMRNHKTDKLASTDCKAKNNKGWKDSKDDLISILAPADNMMKSIEGCIGVTRLMEYGNLSFDKSVESVVRSRTKETSPFYDVWQDGRSGVTPVPNTPTPVAVSPFVPVSEDDFTPTPTPTPTSTPTLISDELFEDLFSDADTPTDDYGSTHSTSTTTLATSLNGKIETNGDVDAFKIIVAKSGELTLYTTGSLDTFGVLYDSTGEEVANNDDADDGNFKITHTVTRGVYYLDVRGFDTSIGDYSVSKEFMEESDSVSSDGEIPQNKLVEIYNKWTENELFYGNTVKYAKDLGDVYGISTENRYHDISAFEKISGVKFSVDGSTDVECKESSNKCYSAFSQSFLSVNPQMLTWVLDNLLTPSPRYNKIQELYNSKGKEFFLPFVYAYKYLRENKNFSNEVNAYNEGINQNKYMASYLRDIYEGESIGNTTPYHIGFWLRRGIDGSDQAVFNALKKILETYDSNLLNILLTPTDDTVTDPSMEDLLAELVADEDTQTDDYSSIHETATTTLSSSSAHSDTLNGKIEVEDDIDAFKIIIVDSGTLTLYTTGSLDTTGMLYNSEGVLIAESDDDGDAYNFKITYPVTRGVYFLDVGGFSTGEYTVHEEFEKENIPVENDKFVDLDGKILEESDHWKVKIIVDKLIPNQKSATIDFRALNCGGELTYLEKESNGYIFNEKITYGSCYQGCTLWIKGDGSEYEERCSSNVGGKLVFVSSNDNTAAVLPF